MILQLGLVDENKKKFYLSTEVSQFAKKLKLDRIKERIIILCRRSTAQKFSISMQMF